MAVRANEVVGQMGEGRHSREGLSIRRQLEQSPIDFRKAHEQLTDFEVVAGHEADLRD
jgi:hypothetical protein